MPSAPREAFNQNANWSFNANIIPHVNHFLNKDNTLSLIFLMLNLTHRFRENLSNINQVFFKNSFNVPKYSIRSLQKIM